MADRFFSDIPLGLGETILEGAEAHHLAHVRRMTEGESVTLFNGDGKSYSAVIESIAKKLVRLRVVAVEESRTEPGFRLVVASAMPKGDRADFLIEKLTELGVTDFVPLQTARSVVHPREARIDKLQRAVIEASKQCGRNVLMRVQAPTSWIDFCRQEGLPVQRFIAHPSGMSGIEITKGDIAIAIGPEGGFTEEEVELALRNGWRIVSLGPRILRIETAALALAAHLSMSAQASA